MHWLAVAQEKLWRWLSFLSGRVLPVRVVCLWPWRG